MSELIGLTIEIGGMLPASLIKEFFEALDSECYEITGPISPASYARLLARQSSFTPPRVTVSART